jgi:methionine aminotransferase
MKIPMTSKLPDVGTTIFAVMSQLAQDCKAINLSQGFPSFEPPAELIDRIDHYLRSGANQYAPMPGVPTLRRAIARKTARMQGRELDAETEITVCTGATEGLFSAIQAIVRPGDEVIVFDPAYDSYEPSVTLAGGRSVHVPLAISDDGFDFSIDWQRLEDALNDKTRLVIINFPHNPTGAILSADDLQRLAALLRNTSAYLLSDEVYEHIVFDGEPHVSALSVDELWERCLVVSSFGKTYHATGWKVGYCMAPAALTAEFRKVHQFTTFAVNTPVQHALADYMQSDPAFYLLPAEARSFLQTTRGFALPVTSRAQHVLPDRRLRSDQRRRRRLACKALDRGSRRRLDPVIGLLREAFDRHPPALLFCERRRHACNRVRATLQTVREDGMAPRCGAGPVSICSIIPLRG